MKNIKLVLVSAALMLLSGLSGCALLFSARHQKVAVTTATPGATIVFEGDTVGQGAAQMRLDKFRMYYDVSVSKDGYKTRNYCMPINKYSPTLAFMGLDLGLVAFTAASVSRGKESSIDPGTREGLGGLAGLVILDIDMRNPKTHRFDKTHTVPALIPLDKRKTGEKYLLMNSTAIDTKSGDLTILAYYGLKKYKAAMKGHTEGTTVGRRVSKEDYKVDNTIFNSSLNRALKKMDFIDTTGTIFPSMSNSMYVDATMKKIKFHVIESPYRNQAAKPEYANGLLCIELEIEWKLLDFYKQTVCTITTNKKSDLFALQNDKEIESTSETIYKTIRDNLEYSIMDVRKQLADKGLLNVTATAEKMDDIQISRPVAGGTKLEDFYKSSVAVKVDDGFGSGAILSEDGYILTAYHVVAGSKKVEVVFSDSTTVVAEVVRKNLDGDVALLKVNKNKLSPFVFSSDNDPDIGVDVYAIGTPKSLELGQSISKGIVSGIRKANGLTILQTDASLNDGNSGGALMTRDGTVLGIISSKLTGYGTEGIGFALLSNEVFAKLGLKYK